MRRSKGPRSETMLDRKENDGEMNDAGTHKRMPEMSVDGKF